MVRGKTLWLNGSHGVQAGTGSLIRENTLGFNGGYGLNALNNTGYASFWRNDLGNVQNGVDMGGNVCNVTPPAPKGNELLRSLVDKAVEKCLPPGESGC